MAHQNTNKKIRTFFGTDGVRGTAGQRPLDTATVTRIGCAAARVFTRHLTPDVDPVIMLGMDTRVSGPDIRAALIDGLSRGGMTVMDCGVLTTPGVAYLTKHSRAAAGVVISASHNPYADNGIKFFSHAGTKLPDDTEWEIEQLMGEVLPAAPVRASDASHLTERYIDFLVSTLPSPDALRGMKVVVDCGNGAAVAVAPKLFAKLGVDAILLNDRPTGTNINAACGALHPENIAGVVVKRGADCGITYDGDADRVIFVDEIGAVRDGDYLLAILSNHYKRAGCLAHDTLVSTVMANLGLARAMADVGITLKQTGVGDRYVFEEMVRSGAVIGGEQSGHIILTEYLQTGDGILSSLQVLNVMRAAGKPLSALCGIMRKYPQVLINERVGRKTPLEQLPKTAQAVREAETRLAGDGRVLVRYSGTENLIRVMIEGADKDAITAMARGIADAALAELGGV